jgi:SAM-dependent methyltransferase
MAASFYDELAPHYHLLYGDWARSIAEQGEALANLLRSQRIHPGEPVLDAACGIGTQTIGLLEQGYHVTASDVSSGAVERLRAELSNRAMQATVRVDDLRTLSRTRPATFAAVLACDNSIPHLLSDEEIGEAFQSCFRCLRPLGIIVLSVRDYATIPRVSPDVRPYGLRYEEGRRFLAVQAWEWHGNQYDLRMYLTSEAADGTCSTRVLVTRYYAVTIDRLLELLGKAGFVDAQRLDSVLHQPVLLARRPHVV